MMWRSSFSLGRIGDVRLELHLSTVRYWFGGLAVTLALLASVVVHELAHALVGRRYGVRTRRVTLWLFGGAAERAGTPPSPRAEALIAAAGPGTSAALGLACWLLALLVDPVLPSVPLVSLLWLGTANLVFAGIALLPGAPLDGGGLVRALVWARTNDRQHAGQRGRRGGGGPVRAVRGDLVGGPRLGAARDSRCRASPPEHRPGLPLSSDVHGGAFDWQGWQR